ncbi:hypothetical protein EG359_17380 [Chryseobacterium joostei]|uniref:Uncharacterized protein n=1 Tax=Chryseobacterium joostei TaxID=112234 RepID=A0A1N7IB32_9FLAO|nr:hypothetical protein [Chryseobacterium joostei]AZB01276.1 hypothetical protein EG359_17380 [Chryseobacterium joostei]SIS34267.1 hypothetical protein SAMN05421768_103676 [Chryseobacterium joostei]
MKTTINKSVVFKSAWKMIKEYAMDLSSALIKAWKFAKENAAYISLKIVKETEKAVAIEVYTADGVTSASPKFYGRKNLLWFPKSMVVNGCAPVWMYNQKMRSF